MTPEPRRPWSELRRVFRLPFTRARLDAEIDDELRFHIEERIEQFVAAGMTRDEAAAEVARRFGDYTTYRRMASQIDQQTFRRRGRMELIDTLRRELITSWRSLRRSPAFSAIAFVTLAVGIGATTAIFTVVDAVVLRPLPYTAAHELVSVLHPTTVPGSGERKWGLSTGGYYFFRAQTRTLDDLGMYRNYSLPVVGDEGAPEFARFAAVTSSIFGVFRAQPHLGRLITDADDRPNGPRLAVLSHEFWQRRFGGDSSIVGKKLQTANGTREIIGVARPGLTLPMPGAFSSTANLAGFGVDVWVPAQQNPAGPFYNSHPWVGIGRLKPGVAAEAAHTEIAALTRRLPEVVPNAYGEEFMRSYNFRGEARLLHESVLGPTLPRTLWTLFGAVGLVLLIAAANVANLFIVRMEARRRESAIRTALGADRVHLLVHHMSESMLLCAGAGVAAVGIAHLALEAMLAIAPTSVPRLATVVITPRSMAFAVGTALVAGLVLGLMPWLRRRLDVAALRDGGRGAISSRRQHAARNTLVVVQTALALVLLASAGLMLRSFAKLRDVDPGFDTANVLTFETSLPFREYDTREKASLFHRELQRRIAALPGVTAVGGASGTPLEDYGTGCSVVFRENRPYAPGEDTPCVATPIIAPGFLESLRVAVRGRAPTWSDFDHRTQAAVITTALANRLWPDEDPIGKGIASNGQSSTVWYRVVGVVGDVRLEGLELPATEAVFYPGTSLQAANAPDGSFNDLAFTVRTDGRTDPVSLVPSIRAILAEMNPRVPFVNERRLTDVVARSMARTSFIMTLLGVAAGVALLLSAVGIYGVISYLVTQRRSEIGVRIALGARVSQVARMVVMQSVRLAAAGTVVGVVGALLATRLLQSLLFGVSATDPVVMASVVVLLLALAALAAFAPARRAARTDPVETLRGS